MTASIPDFAVITGEQVHRALAGRQREVLDVVEDAYLTHGAGDSVLPPSLFLRFPDRPTARIIALPASLGGRAPVDGMKWVSSFRTNVDAGIPRASAVVVLNDRETGYPVACLEGSIISATRTASSAALAADRLTAGRPRPRRLGIIGTGLIARYVHDHLVGTGWDFEEIGLHDREPRHAQGFARHLQAVGEKASVTVHSGPEPLIRSCDLVVLTTVASTPYLDDPSWFAHRPVVLNLSLRDLAPEVILAAANVLDDVDHCLTAETSVHLAERACGGRDFVTGSFGDVLTGRTAVPVDRTVVFSPFGLGVLDLAVSRMVYEDVRRRGELSVAENFFYDVDRHATAGLRAGRG